MTQVAIVYFSGYGHTIKQAEAVQKGAADVDGVHATLVAAPHAFHARLLGAASALREPFASRI
jgi:flavodoxin